MVRCSFLISSSHVLTALEQRPLRKLSKSNVHKPPLAALSLNPTEVSIEVEEAGRVEEVAMEEVVEARGAGSLLLLRPGRATVKAQKRVIRESEW